MDENKPPDVIKGLPPRPNYSALVKEACESYVYAMNKTNDGMNRVTAIEKAISTMVAADPTLQKLMVEAVKSDVTAYSATGLQPAPETSSMRAYSDAMQAAFKTRCL